MADTTDNAEAFGRPSNADGGGAYPQVRRMALPNAAPRAVIDAALLPHPQDR